MRCFNRIASNACCVFLGFCKGSTQIWIGGSSFRHGDLHRGLVLWQIKFQAGIRSPLLKELQEIRSKAASEFVARCFRWAAPSHRGPEASEAHCWAEFPGFAYLDALLRRRAGNLPGHKCEVVERPIYVRCWRLSGPRSGRHIGQAALQSVTNDMSFQPSSFWDAVQTEERKELGDEHSKKRPMTLMRRLVRASGLRNASPLVADR